MAEVGLLGDEAEASAGEPLGPAITHCTARSSPGVGTAWTWTATVKKPVNRVALMMEWKFSRHSERREWTERPDPKGVTRKRVW